MPDNNLDRAIALSKSGKKLEAREILKTILRANQQNETAWLWFADTYPDNQNRIKALEECLKNNPTSHVAQKWLATFKAEETKAANKSQHELPDFQSSQDEQIQSIDKKMSVSKSLPNKMAVKQNMKNNQPFIILAGIFGLALLCGATILGLWTLNRQSILSLPFLMKFPSISGITRPTDADCQQAYDALASETNDDGEIMNFLLNNNQAPDTVGSIAKACISDGWKPAPSVVPNRCLDAWVNTGFDSGLSTLEVWSESFFQNWVSDQNNKDHPTWSYLNKCVSSGAWRTLPDP